MISPKFFTYYQVAAGACDSLTGILLLAAPQLALKLMGVSHIPASSSILISFIGAFVFSVGLTYLLFAAAPRSALQLGSARAAWLITAVERICAGSFVMAAVLSHQLEPAWSSITLVDLVLAGFQLVGLRRNWLEALR